MPLSAVVGSDAGTPVKSPQATSAMVMIAAPSAASFGPGPESRRIMFGELKGEGYFDVRNSSSDCLRLTSTISAPSFATTFRGSWGAGMPSIRDLVAAIRQRDGVDAAIVLGRDGLLIEDRK